jgi:peptidyl-prolyl cis-trans isomerase SurA
MSSPVQRALRSCLVVVAGLLALQPATAHAVVVERIVAVVGDRPILLSELRQRARPFLAQILQKVPPGAQQAAAESQMFKELIERMVEEELEAQAADRARISVTAEEIDNAFRNIAAAQNKSVAKIFDDARTTSGLSDQDYRDEIRRQILEGKMLQLRVKGRLRLTEDDVRATFDKVVREERHRLEYHPAWIVLRVPAGSSADALAERQRLASDLAARARRGEDFAALARRYSDDTATREAGGDLGGRAPQGSPAAVAGKRPVMAPDLEAALMALEPGQVAEPMRAGDAIVVMKLVDRAPSRYASLEASRAEMMQRAQGEVLERAKRKWLDELKRRTHLEVRL